MALWERWVLPRLIDCACGTDSIDQIRRRVCGALFGDVVEVGFGSGHNLEFISPDVTTLYAIEPSDGLRRIARQRVEASGLHVVWAGRDGQSIDLADNSMDAALSTFTLCSIPDIHRALKELHRVLKPGGHLHFAEHGRAPDRRLYALQRVIEPANKRIAGGCHVTRDMASEIQAVGFVLEEVRAAYGPDGPRTHSFIYEGVARKI